MSVFSILKNLFSPKLKDLKVSESSEPELKDLDVSNSTGPKLKKIGITDPICPYCNKSLDKMPGRKKKCPNCSNFIYVRTRPLDKKKILIREDQFIEFSEQQAIANGTYEELMAKRRRYEAVRTKAIKEYGREPSENDIQMIILQEDLINYANSNKWGLYRNTILYIGGILESEGKLKEAIDTYIEVCYLDMNGPMNCGTQNPELLRKYPPFNLKLGRFASAIVYDLVMLMKEQNYTVEDAKLNFMKIAKIQHKSLNLPLAPETAWNQLIKKNKLIHKNLRKS